MCCGNKTKVYDSITPLERGDGVALVILANELLYYYCLVVDSCYRKKVRDGWECLCCTSRFSVLTFVLIPDQNGSMIRLFIYNGVYSKLTSWESGVKSDYKGKICTIR